MTPPGNKADARAAPRAPAHKLRTPLVFAAILALVFLTHLPLLGLPYYWDEAGYFIPAARDIYEGGDFIPHTTLSNAHPPLVMAWIALCWKLFGFHVEVARAAMLFVSSVALLGVFRLGERVANTRVAAAAVLCTALYPVFFAQSTLAHLDMAVAALTLWALVLYLPPRGFLEKEAGDVEAGAGVPEGRGLESLGLGSLGARRALCVVLLALAALAKETAALVPLTLFGWEVLCLLARRRERLSALVCTGRRASFARSLALPLACAPLALWFAYHRARTGYTLGNPEYFRYNVESTLNLARVLDTLWRRLWHVTVHMNLYVLTLAGIAAMLLKPLRDGDGRERPRIEVPVQLLFAALILAHVVALSVVGGAVLARYMLPVLPLVIIIWASTVWRRAAAWPLVLAVVCGAFAYRTVVNPAHSFPWEENLSYRDFVLLHRDAARFLAEEYPDARVLTSWPASDELKNPYFGYTPRPLRVFVVDNFKRETLTEAAAQKSEYDVAFIYTSHGGLELEEARQILGGHVVFHQQSRGHWAAVVRVSGEQ